MLHRIGRKKGSLLNSKKMSEHMICLGILRQMTTTKRGASKNTTPFMQRIEYWVIYVALSYIKLNVRDNI